MVFIQTFYKLFKVYRVFVKLAADLSNNVGNEANPLFGIYL